jgi:hypothetical protein
VVVCDCQRVEEGGGWELKGQFLAYRTRFGRRCVCVFVAVVREVVMATERQSEEKITRCEHVTSVVVVRLQSQRYIVACSRHPCKVIFTFRPTPLTQCVSCAATTRHTLLSLPHSPLASLSRPFTHHLLWAVAPHEQQRGHDESDHEDALVIPGERCQLHTNMFNVLLASDAAARWAQQAHRMALSLSFALLLSFACGRHTCIAHRHRCHEIALSSGHDFIPSLSVCHSHAHAH